jgi:Transposase DDE domain
MTGILSDVAEAMQIVLTSTAEAAACNSGFVRRRSKLTGPAFVQTLTFGWLSNPEATLEELAQTANTVGVSISPQGLDQRFTPQAAACVLEVLQAAVARVLTADPVAIPILQRFPGGVMILDSTTLALPDPLACQWPSCTKETATSGIASLKLHVRFDLLHGTLQGPVVQAGCSSDKKSPPAQAALPSQALHLADLGYFHIDRLQQLHDEGVHWLTRWLPKTQWLDATGRWGTISTLLAHEQRPAIDIPIQLGKERRLSCRLLAIRAPAAVEAQRRERLQKDIQHRKRQAHPDRWTLTKWTVYVTNVPSERMNLQEAQVIARCRWQVELLFKLWKQYGRIDQSRSQRPWRVLCEVYAKLLGMVVQHWVLLVSCWSYANRSLPKAARTVRRHALHLAAVVAQRQLVCKTLEIIQRCLKQGCRINRRHRQPATFQLLLNLTEGG